MYLDQTVKFYSDRDVCDLYCMPTSSTVSSYSVSGCASRSVLSSALRCI